MNNPQRRSNKNGMKPVRPRINENWIAEVSSFPWVNKNIVWTPLSFGFSYFRIISIGTLGRESKERKEKLFYKKKKN